MKFINLLTEKKIQRAEKHRLAACPYPESCYPSSYNVDRKFAGACVGLIHTADNLDCVRLCIFYREVMNSRDNTQVEVGDLKVIEHFMTPSEAVTTAKVLLSAVEDALDFSGDYQKHYKHLDKIRKEQKKKGVGNKSDGKANH